MTGFIRSKFTKATSLLLLFMLLLPFGSLTWGEEEQATAPTLVVLYKDKTGNIRAETDEDGTTRINFRNDMVKTISNIHVDISELSSNPGIINMPGKKQPYDLPLSLPLGKKNASSSVELDWELVEGRPRRSNLETMGRLLIPFAGALAIFGGFNPTFEEVQPTNEHGHDVGEKVWKPIPLDYTGTDLPQNVGHYLVMATVSNLAQEIDENLANLLEDSNHHLGGVIPPEWAAKGAMALIMLGGGGLKGVADKSDLRLGQAIPFFAKSQTVKAANLFLGEVSGQAIDRVTNLSPKVRRIATAAMGGAASGGLYYLLATVLDAQKETKDLHSKISNAAILGVSGALTPFLRDFVGNYTNNKAVENIATHSIVASVALPIGLGVYGILAKAKGSYDKEDFSGFSYIARLAGGSFAKMAGYAMGNVFGKDTIRSALGDSRATPVAMAATFAATTALANWPMIQYNTRGSLDKATGKLTNLPYGTLGQEFVAKLRDGIYVASITNGATALIEDLTRRLAPREQRIRLNLKITPAQVANEDSSDDSTADEEAEEALVYM